MRFFWIVRNLWHKMQAEPEGRLELEAESRVESGGVGWSVESWQFVTSLGTSWQSFWACRGQGWCKEKVDKDRFLHCCKHIWKSTCTFEPLQVLSLKCTMLAKRAKNKCYPFLTSWCTRNLVMQEAWSNGVEGELWREESNDHNRRHLSPWSWNDSVAWYKNSDNLWQCPRCWRNAKAQAVQAEPVKSVTSRCLST